MYETTVKRFGARGFGFLNNPLPGGKDVFIQPPNGSPPLERGQKVLVRKEHTGKRGPVAVVWELVVPGEKRADAK